MRHGRNKSGELRRREGEGEGDESDYSSGHYIKVIYCRVEVAAAAAAAAAFVNDKMHVDLNRERKREGGKWQVASEKSTQSATL